VVAVGGYVLIQVEDIAEGDGWTLFHGDCVEVIRGIPDRSIGLSIYSPPFSSLYTYSDSERDMGNCADDAEFIKHYSFILPELYRITRPGRLVAVHCKDLVDYQGTSGRAGLRDFPGDLIRAHEAAGFKYHSRITIWKCPVNEQRKTHARGLNYKDLRRDSSYSRVGLPDYLLLFRRWAEEGEDTDPITHTRDDFPLEQWQEWASPVWMTIRAMNVLNVVSARDDEAERHLCPLQLDVVERAVRLWSKPGDTVFSPFAGVGSEGVVPLEHGRRFVGIELKDEYFRQAVRNLEAAGRQQSLFAGGIR
jgi:DNA modification methylase